jgi:WhiB family redox-sensing transcriptional regulator
MTDPGASGDPSSRETPNELSGIREEQPKFWVLDELQPARSPDRNPESTRRMSNHWRQYARCLGADPETFYPPPESDDGAVAAKAICAVCPVREPCLEHAITHREKQGVWGGLDERERRRLVRQRRKTA